MGENNTITFGRKEDVGKKRKVNFGRKEFLPNGHQLVLRSLHTSTYADEQCTVDEEK
jgi:hypothetical protein